MKNIFMLTNKSERKIGGKKVFCNPTIVVFISVYCLWSGKEKY